MGEVGYGATGGGGWAAGQQQMEQNGNQGGAQWGTNGSPYSNGTPASEASSYPPSTQNLLGGQSNAYLDQNNLPTITENGNAIGGAAAAGGAAAVTPFHDGAGQGEIYVVKRTFEPSLDDELVLFPGDHIQVQVKYDDGWAFGVNLNSGSPPGKGVFPFDCLGDLQDGSSNGPSNNGEQHDAQDQQQHQHQDAHPTETGTERAVSPSASQAGKASPAPYQLPTLRADSPFDAAPPTIRLEDDTGRPRSLVVAGEPSKRTSSLIASRDADLFMALGEVLDKDTKA